MYRENLDKLPQASKIDIGYEGNGGSRADCLPLGVETSWQVHKGPLLSEDILFDCVIL